MAARLLIEGFGERYAGMSDKLSKTIAGKESNALDALRMQAGKAATDTTRAYGQALDQTIATVQKQQVSRMASEYDKRVAADLELVSDVLGGQVTAKEMGRALIPTVKGTLTELGTVLKDGLVGAWSISKEVAAGAAQGVGESMGSSAEKGAKDSLKINSPSRVFIEIGKNVAEGYATGIEAGMSRVEDAMNLMLMGGKRALRPGESRARTAEENRQRAEAYVDDPRVRAYLDMLAKAEGADYNTLFGGGQFSDMSHFPDWAGKSFTYKKKDGTTGRDVSRAAGRYQFLPGTWSSVSSFLGLQDFSARSQDIAAAELLRQRGALPFILAGDINGAMRLSNKEWASLPGSPYGQPTRKAVDLTAFYNQRLGATSGQVVEVKASRSAPLPVLIVDNKAINAGTVKAGLGLASLSDVSTAALGGLAPRDLPLFEKRVEVPSLTGAPPSRPSNVVSLFEHKAKKGAKENYSDFVGGGQPGGLFAGLGANIGEGVTDKMTVGQGAMEGVKDSLKEVKNIGKEAFGQWAQGVGSIVHDFVLLGETGPGALKKVTAQVLASAAQESAVLSIVELAKGFATMFTNPAESASHFTASAVFAGVAAGTGIAGRALAGKPSKGQISDDQRRQAAINNVASEGAESRLPG